MTWRRVIRPFMFVLAAVSSGSAGVSTQQQAPLPEGYVRLTQPDPQPAAGNTTENRGAIGKVYQVGFRTGDEVMSGLADWARKHNVKSGYITGIGGFVSATFGWIDPQVRGGMKKIEVREKVEVTSFTGNFTPGPNGSTNLHVHALVTGGDGVARGGHLISAQVSPIMDLFITEFALVGAPPVPEGR